MSQLKYKAFEADVRGLSPDDFKRFLENKLKVLVAENKVLSTILKKATESCVREVCIRPKISDPKELDRRRSGSRAWYSYVLDRTFSTTSKEPTSTTMSPIKSETETSGIRGTERHSKKLHKDYHEKQESIFRLLNRFLYKLQQPDLQEDLVPQDNFTEAFCIKIDFYTSAILDFCVSFIDNVRMYPDFEGIALLALLTYKCQVIVMERNIVAYQKPSNLMEEKGWRDWKNHLMVLMSYAALLVSLKMLAKLCTRKYRKIKDSLDGIKALYGLTENHLGDIIFVLG